MKISCTVEEFAKLVRGCNDAIKGFHCTYCPLHDLCDGGGFIEQFITHDSIVRDDEKTGEEFIETFLAEGSAQDACD